MKKNNQWGGEEGGEKKWRRRMKQGGEERRSREVASFPGLAANFFVLQATNAQRPGE